MKLSFLQLKILAALLGVVLTAVLVATGLVYYFEIDYFLPPALVLVMIPLATQLRAALVAIERRARLAQLQARVEKVEDGFKTQDEG